MTFTIHVGVDAEHMRSCNRWYRRLSVIHPGQGWAYPIDISVTLSSESVDYSPLIFNSSTSGDRKASSRSKSGSGGTSGLPMILF